MAFEGEISRNYFRGAATNISWLTFKVNVLLSRRNFRLFFFTKCSISADTNCCQPPRLSSLSPTWIDHKTALRLPPAINRTSTLGPNFAYHELEWTSPKALTLSFGYIFTHYFYQRPVLFTRLIFHVLRVGKCRRFSPCGTDFSWLLAVWLESKLFEKKMTLLLKYFKILLRNRTHLDFNQFQFMTSFVSESFANRFL
jgi:hypothetical protein